ncbi:MAG: DUF1574 family protein [Magnetococcales bacterium]|nr:DUF1574 family protein [Magnetococcales bacterium]
MTNTNHPTCNTKTDISYKQESGSSSLSSLLRLFAIILLIFVTPMLVVGDKSSRFEFDPGHRQNLAKIKPDYVFIGSSMLVSRMDVDHFNTIMDGKIGYMLSDVGALSSLWFLWLKNSLIASGVKPKVVFIFFRHTALTNPAQNSSSVFIMEKIQKNSLDSEPIYDQVMGYHKDFFDLMREWLLKLYPIQDFWHKDVNWIVDSAGFLFGLPEYASYKYQAFVHPEQITTKQRRAMMAAREALKSRIAYEVFTDKNQRDQKNHISKSFTAESQLNFKKRLPLSFLPQIVRLGKEAGLKLVFVRIKSRPNRNNSVSKSLLMDRYIADLSQYAEKNGIAFHDFTQDHNITFPMYNDGAHIAPEYMKFWTENFVVRLGEHLK